MNAQEICKQWLVGLFENDKNNTIVKTYNNWKKTNYKNNKTALKKILKDDVFINDLIKERINVKLMELDLLDWNS